MTRTICDRLFSIAFALLLVTASTASFGQTINMNAQRYEPWETSYQTALQRSKDTGRPVMLVFAGSDWCAWCNKLTTEIFSTHEFARWSTDNVIKVEVDFPKTSQLPESIRKQNQMLKDKFGHIIKVYPTILFVNPDGIVIGKSGYLEGGPQTWIKKASEIVRPTTSNDLLARK